ncbi:hypothetical protein HPB50_013368 [Hyalomma asiaticum]|uniref:Uncharacterized protein n=1 Tax=Hyalomma asiaticum TaxID=266040 RepID=A0ACB7RP68_HYAAI|nr:hypothetical protein HPB50_013368 [Hyalomma asiaticum]
MHGAKDQAAHSSSENVVKNRWSNEQREGQIMAGSRMPSLLKEDYKIIVRPRDCFKVTDYGVVALNAVLPTPCKSPGRNRKKTHYFPIMNRTF